MVGLIRSSDEASNDCGAKELAYNRFFSETLTSHKRRSMSGK